MIRTLSCLACVLVILIGCNSKRSSDKQEIDVPKKDTIKASQQPIQAADTVPSSEQVKPIYSDYDCTSTVKVFGFYSNEKSSDGEHAGGYFLHLWSVADRLVGKLTFTEGLIGSGTAEWIFDSKQQADSISFRSTVYNYELDFTGIVLDTAIVGNFKWGNGNIDSLQALEKCCIDASIHKDYNSLKELIDRWEEFEEY